MTPNESKLPVQWQLSTIPPSKVDPLLLLPPRVTHSRSKHSHDKGSVKRKPVNKIDETILPSK